MDRDENPTQTIDACAPDPQTVDRLLGGAHHDPHAVLGAHPHDNGTVVRVLRPHADEVHVVRVGGEGHPLVKVHDAGLFSGVVPGPPADYRLAVRYGDRVDIVDDPYRWLPTLGEVDLHLISEGRHERLWDVLGAHVRTYDTPAGAVTGTSFAVWAPTAQGVRVTGDFDGWSGWAHPMRALGSTGVWELFIPGIGAGTRYKFRILGADGRWREKSDPLAFRTEIPPATASVVDAVTHEWGDHEWIHRRAQRQAHAEPMSIYEVHLGSWRAGLDYREMARQLVDYLDETGFTHVELLPVAEHPFGGSWGYQVTSYYAPTARFGTPDDFRWFVDHLHQHGYGVLVDWVPAHFPRDEWALAKFDGTPLYEHADPRRGEQPDWGTLVFDFGRKEVRNFLVANALYWIDQFHIDGLRVDAVASMLYLDYSRPEGQWLPNIHGGRENLDAVAFLQEMNATVYRTYPGVVTVAEESTAWPGVSRPTHLGGLGFGFKWNMGWMHDTLDYTGRDPIYRGYHHNQMTFSLMYAFSENFVLPLSHDEVVHGKGSLWQRMPGDAWNKAANLRALLAYMWAHPGKQLLFQGGEFGQEREWSEQRSLDWHLLDDPLHGGIKNLVGDMNRAYRELPALWTRDVTPDGFSWIDANDSSGNVLSFLRHGVDADGKPTVMACIANFSGSPKPDYRVGLPFAGRWREVLNTDATNYGGSGWGNYGGVDAEQYVWHGRPASAVLQLPPAGVLWLAPEPFEGAVRRSGTASASAPSEATRTGPIAVVPAAGPDDAVTLAPAGGAATPTSAPSPAPSDDTPTPPTGLPITPPASATDTSLDAPRPTPPPSLRTPRSAHRPTSRPSPTLRPPHPRTSHRRPERRKPRPAQRRPHRPPWTPTSRPPRRRARRPARSPRHPSPQRRTPRPAPWRTRRPTTATRSPPRRPATRRPRPFRRTRRTRRRPTSSPAPTRSPRPPGARPTSPPSRSRRAGAARPRTSRGRAPPTRPPSTSRPARAPPRIGPRLSSTTRRPRPSRTPPTIPTRARAAPTATRRPSSRRGSRSRASAPWRPRAPPPRSTPRGSPPPRTSPWRWPCGRARSARARRATAASGSCARRSATAAAPRRARPTPPCPPGRPGGGVGPAPPACRRARSRPATRPRTGGTPSRTARPGSEALSTVSGTGELNAMRSQASTAARAAHRHPQQRRDHRRHHARPQRRPPALGGVEQQHRRERGLQRHRDPEQHGREHRAPTPLGHPARDQPDQQHRVDLTQHERAVQRATTRAPPPSRTPRARGAAAAHGRRPAATRAPSARSGPPTRGTR